MKRMTSIIMLLAILVASFLVFTACDEPEHTCSFGEWAVIDQPNCTEAGLKVQVCECGKSRTEIIPATNHSYAHVVTDSTCTEQGFTTHTCVDCGDSYVDAYVDALGHDEIGHIAQAPTCTEVGWYAYVTCSRCDYSTYNEIPATNHTNGHTYDNTCDTICNVCGATRTIEHTYSSDCDIICNVCEHERVSSVSHTYDNTCDTTCNECGATRTIEHTYSSDCDIICNVCKYERAALVDHTAYDNSCDTTCNDCGAIRTIEHTYDNTCDTICNICEDVRTIKHTYSSNCDIICNVCGRTRTTSTAHSDVNPADNSCDNCGVSVSTLTFTLRDDGQSYAITGANSNIYGDITLPSTYNDKPITTIGERAFYECTSLTSVTFGENSQLTTIGESAFSGCDSLTSIVIPDSVTTIGSYAFEYCTGLTNVYYTGTEEQWNNITIRSYNYNLTNATRSYYSDCIHNSGSNLWRYDSDGNISTELTVGDWIVDVAATCTTNGTKHRTCSVCDETVTLEIPAAHSLGDDGPCTVCGEEVPYTITNDATYAFVEKNGVLQSTNHTYGSSSSYVITARTTITIAFEYSVSSENSCDYFYIYHNTTKKVAESGTSNFNIIYSYSITLNAGDTLTFKYTKDSSSSSGDDCCYIKNLTITTASN